MLWWFYAVACYLTTVLVPAWTNSRLEGIVDDARCLRMYTKDKEFVLANLNGSFAWRMPPFRFTSCIALLVAMPVPAALACWVSIFAHMGAG